MAHFPEHQPEHRPEHPVDRTPKGAAAPNGWSPQIDHGSGRRIVGLLTLVVVIALSWFHAHPANPNTSVRLFTAIALVETGSPHIDSYAHLTIDKAEYEGHYILDKAPGITILALPAAAMVSWVKGSTAAQMMPDWANGPFLTHLWQVLAVTVFTVMIPLTLAGSLALFAVCRDAFGDPRGAALAAIGFALGTPVWGWTESAFGHAPAAALLILGFAAVYFALRPEMSLRRRYLLAIGAGLAFAAGFSIEHTFALPALAIGGYAVVASHRQPWGHRFGLGAMVVGAGLLGLLPLGLYNATTFGTPFAVGYGNVVGFEGMDQGFLGLTYPKAGVLAAITIGPAKGILWYSPLLLVGAVGLARLVIQPGARSLALISLSVAVIYWLLNASYFYWDGGGGAGARHIVPAFPFLMIGVAAAFTQCAPGGTGRSLIRMAFLYSVAVGAAVAAINPFASAALSFPVYDYFIPRMARLMVNSRLSGATEMSSADSIGLLLLTLSATGRALISALDWAGRWPSPRASRGAAQRARKVDTALAFS